ncbi:MAG: 4-aminobutyrate--2-oxoglutarate transaminase [Gammaproteobacteria bacterium]|nr:4-aminobutyrate--2-oxoglutarate transaminase [Gammaproteobacteria bacterium]NDA44128.1 4-aminobutyrate--2-oxoglutarate transaminase [Gammaproteobacteria bacterium]NDB16318.1 4-aminobutyrate--2-oxoglutarate transaminase [Gammaproteobacteria bacterium]NDB24748.1 4-aminobutyrate--2-oxoglutarate transaminase [Gammaproteobacteria bacterium]NDE86956.1 4-aminobutyrate--2-oxoglutarate transaminase [Gammaproteobacteria bacterium]
MAAIPRGVGNLLQVYAEHASNAEIWDVEGRRYIDFASGIAVLNTGHLHPRVQAAVAAQLAKLSHTCFQVTPYENYVALAERLNEIVPGSGPKKTIFLTTGAEAIENAVKIARHHTKRSAVIAFGGSFHGRTLACMSLTGKVQPYKAGFGSMLPDVFHAPFPIEYHGVSVAQSLAAIENLFKADVDPQRVAALIVEPVQGEGGFYVAPPEFLQALRALCDRHGIVFIVDEVQTGFARTGRMFAIEHSGVEPDLVTLAKSLAGGLPLSAVVGKAEIMDSPAPGGLGGTYAGSPLGCAAGLAVLEVIESEQLCARAERLGAAVRARLTDLQSRWPCIGEVRGQGAMVAMELVKDRRPDAPDAELTKALVQAAGRRGLVLLSCGVHANVIRFLMPLTTPDAILAEGLAILEAALEDVAR